MNRSDQIDVLRQFRQHTPATVRAFVAGCCVLFVAVWVGCGGGAGPDSRAANSSSPDSDESASIGSASIGSSAAATQPAQAEGADAGPSSHPALDRDLEIERVDRLVAAEEFAPAVELLQRLLLLDPRDVEVLFRLAGVKAGEGKLAEAVDLLDGIPEDDPDAGIPALGQSADWCFTLERYDQAEQKYRRVLELVPEANLARRKLAHLLNRQGRRHEAAEQIRELCRRGDVRQDELHALLVLSDAMISNPNASGPAEVDYAPIGASGQARILFTEKRYAEAAELLRPTIASGDAPPSVVAFYGRVVAEAQDDEAFHWWLGKTDPSVAEYSEYWAAIATYLAIRQEYQAATRALLETLDRDPTDFRSINRLIVMLRLGGQPQQIEKWEQRWYANRESLRANNRISVSSSRDVDAMAKLAEHLSALDRRLEAVIWNSLESYYRKQPAEVMNRWNLELQKLVASGEGFPDRASRLCNMSLDDYPLPDVADLQRSAPSRLGDGQWAAENTYPPSLSNIADQIGLTHRFRVASSDVESGYAIYQMTGGGVAVLDYDCDGNPDLYFAQGAADPPDFVSDQSNVLYRNEDGRLRAVTGNATAEEFRYTIGCTSGDWNQDGFVDLISANMGVTRLFINNGDGTFVARSLDGSEDLARVPASIAIADLNSDGLSDLFELNYIQDPDIAKRPQRDAAGNVIKALGPTDFVAAIDRVGMNDGSGGIIFQPISHDSSAAQYGLGVVIADLDGNPGNDVFVGNDSAQNQLWVRDGESESWSDIAVVQGAAFSFGGAGTASMGIAASDFDKSGSLDLHVANFQDESACLYLRRESSYQDRAAQYGLAGPSLSVLGFGSQAIDYDNDGLPDLAVTNGHIDKYQTMTGTFEQLPQLFGNLGDRFQLVEVADSTHYWQTRHLGRGMARLDFNRDGRNDLVLTHVAEPSALLLNETAASNHWLQLQLIGVQSERDAVGARIHVRFGDRESTEWLMGGDGYLCRNEQVISCGLGEATRVDELTVFWPSGVEQTWRDLAVDRRLLVIEDQPNPFELK